MPALAASDSRCSAGRKAVPDDVLAGGGKFEVGDRAEEFVRHLHQQAGAVAGTFVGAHGTAVLEVAQGGQGGVDDVVAGLAAERGDDGQAAGVLLLAPGCRVRLPPASPRSA